MANFIERNLDRNPVVTISVIAIVAVALVTGAGFMARLTAPLGRAIGGLMASFRGALGKERRA